jgi:uncharacterized protein (UPF0332 family)
VTDQEALSQQLQAMVEKGKRALKAAQEHLAHGDTDFASSKAYYAVFHLMQAALLTKSKTYSKHAGVISGFSEQFIKPGTFPPSFGETIQRLRKDRELGDYGYQLSVDPEEAARDVEASAEVVRRIEEYLHPFLTPK